MKLENWAITGNPYQATEIRRTYLTGNVYGHHDKRHFNGKSIRTSHIIGKTTNNMIVTASKSLYDLGVPDKQYNELYPDCLARLLDTLPVIN